ncbi:MAG: hypothetical protein KF886_06605 [Candidatus Hydrogenedentes bacterium]|nr:hypothetical protein [Candidatus Hydrogenedentota bacterium]
MTDLDTWPCAPSLISSWFGSSPDGSPGLPKGLCFRIAVREIESWIMADRHAWAAYIEIAATNFPTRPDELPDPKQFLINVIRAKGKKKMHADMLPRGSGHVGPLYNDVLCRFIQSTWSANRASRFSPSLMRAINALHRI